MAGWLPHVCSSPYKKTKWWPSVKPGRWPVSTSNLSRLQTVRNKWFGNLSWQPKLREPLLTFIYKLITYIFSSLCLAIWEYLILYATICLYNSLLCFPQMPCFPDFPCVYFPFCSLLWGSLGLSESVFWSSWSSRSFPPFTMSHLLGLCLFHDFNYS